MTIAIDSSTPAIISAGASGTTATSNAFSPPAGSLILVAFSDYHSVTVASITDSLGSHLTYTRLRAENFGSDTNVELWVADCPSAHTGMTVTASVPGTVANDSAISAIVLTGAKAAASQTGATNGTGSFSGLASCAVTTTANGSLVIGVCVVRVNTGTVTPASGQTNTFGSQSLVLQPGTGTHFCQTTTSPTSSSGTVVTLNDTSPAANEYGMLAVEILAGATIVPYATPVTFQTAVQRSLSY